MTPLLVYLSIGAVFAVLLLAPISRQAQAAQDRALALIGWPGFVLACLFLWPLVLYVAWRR